MKRRHFIAGTLAAAATSSFAQPRLPMSKVKMSIHFLRHATFVLEVGDVKILVDPMLSDKDAMDPVKGAAVEARIPMVPPPIGQSELQELLLSIDLILITHTHRDHWDKRAQELIRKEKPILCQPGDEKTIGDQGFTNVKVCEPKSQFAGLTIHRTDGKHGTGEIGKRMGKVSGFVIEIRNTRLYIAGDTIWCPEVSQAIELHKPDAIVVNAGAAQLLEGGPITMTANDVISVCQKAPDAKVIAVHMETVNHCLLTRPKLKEALMSARLQSQCIIPADGETISA